MITITTQWGTKHQHPAAQEAKPDGDWLHLLSYTGAWVAPYMRCTIKGVEHPDHSINDGVADLYVGRLPASSVPHAEAMVAKIIAYETAPNTKTWEKNVMLVADDADEETEWIFESISDEAADLIPEGMTTVEAYLGWHYDGIAAPLTDAIKTNLNAGSLVLNYVGHGSWQVWANEGIFEHGDPRWFRQDVDELRNGATLPFIVNMACLTGYFADPESFGYPSLTETLMRSEEKGAVAAFMPTGMTSPTDQRILSAALFEAIFTKDIRTLGPAVSMAKQTLLANGVEYEETSETFLLFGDPAMRLKIPLPEAPTRFKAKIRRNDIALSWKKAKDCNGSAVSGYNLYRSTTPGGGYYTKLNKRLLKKTAYKDKSAQSGHWYYAVTAVDGDGLESVFSTEQSVVSDKSSKKPRKKPRKKPGKKPGKKKKNGKGKKAKD